MQKEVTPRLVEGQLVTHNTSGLRLILASSEPKEMKLNTALAQAEQMINHLATLAKFLVVDLGAGLIAISIAKFFRCVTAIS